MLNESMARIREYVRQRERLIGEDVIAAVLLSPDDVPAMLTFTDLRVVLQLADSAERAYDRGYQAARNEFEYGTGLS